MHRFSRLAILGALASLAVGAGLTSVHSTLAAPAVIGHVYVNDNTSPANTIAAFDRHIDGSLTPLAGSPFAAGGSGASVPSQGALQLSSDGRYLLAVDAGSNQISVLHIGRGGSLSPVEDSPVWSGGIKPVSIAIYRSLVYVANDGNSSGGANYTGFRLSPAGQLSPIPGSTFALPSPTTVGTVVFDDGGTHLAGTRVDSSLIDSFKVGHDGLLTPAPGSPFAAQGYGPFGSKFRPTGSHQLYVSNAHNASGGPAPGTVSAFNVSADGSFSSIGASPYAATGQIATCWVEISHDGRNLFGVNTGSNSVSWFAIEPNGTLSLGGSVTLKGTLPNLGALDARIDPSDRFLYVVERGANAVAGLRVSDDGSLTELSSSPTALPAGSVAFGIVVN